MNCPACGHANPEGSQFCRGCGAALAAAPMAASTPPATRAEADWQCPACQRDNRASARFCAGCGAPAVASTPITTPAEAVVPPAMPSEPAAASLPPTPANADATAAPTCPHCHAPRPLGGRFCKACGQPFDEATTLPLSTLMPAPPMTPPMPAANHTFVPTLTATMPVSDADATVVVPTPAQAPTPAAPPRHTSAAPAAPAAGSNKVVIFVLAGAALLAGLGGLATWKLRQHGTPPDQAANPAPATSSMLTTAAPVTTPPPAATTPVEAASAVTTPANPAPPALAATAPAAPAAADLTNTAPAASAPAPAPITLPPAPSQASAPAPESVPDAAPVPSPPLPTRHVRARAPAPPAAPTAPSRDDIALKLVREGEAAFSQQNYSVAIADAKAALAVAPDNARASHLLQEAQQAQQNAMNSISIQ